MKAFLCLIVFGFVLFGCNSREITNVNDEYQSESLSIRKISNHVYEHTSFLTTQDFGKVPCNGMIILDDNEVVVFDTPADDQTSEELINWIENTLHGKITAIVSTHFHDDCLGGLNEFHKHNIPSYAYKYTIDQAKERQLVQPQNQFDEFLELPVGNKKVYAEFMGEGHTRDNIIGYFPEEKIMFGGCLIKEIGAGKGNLEDANVTDWPETVKKVKAKYPQAKIIIPGHGKSGGEELLDYTINLFK